MKNAYTFYKIVNPIFPVFRVLFPKFVSTLREVGLAMINTVSKGYNKQILEVKDIVKLAKE